MKICHLGLSWYSITYFTLSCSLDLPGLGKQKRLAAEPPCGCPCYCWSLAGLLSLLLGRAMYITTPGLTPACLATCGLSSQFKSSDLLEMSLCCSNVWVNQCQHMSLFVYASASPYGTAGLCTEQLTF